MTASSVLISLAEVSLVSLLMAALVSAVKRQRALAYAKANRRAPRRR